MRVATSTVVPSLRETLGESPPARVGLKTPLHYSLEAGKKADIILVDWFKPHMVPMNMPVYRLVYFANGEDVSTVLVDGRILMRDRRVLTVNEEEILTGAQREADLAIRRAGLQDLTALPEGFWGKTRLTR